MIKLPPLNKPVEYKTQTQKTPVNLALVMSGNIVLIFVAVFCTFGAFTTSFSIHLSMTAFWLWFLSAIILSISVTIHRLKGLAVFSAIAFVLILWNITEIIDGLKYVINVVTETYNVWLSITVLFPGANKVIDDPTAFLAAAGVLVTMLLSVAVCMRRSLIGTFLATAPIVFLTFVITDKQAELIYILGIIAVYLTMLVSNAIAPDDFFKRGKAVFPAFAISFVFMFIVYLFSPSGSYVRSNNIMILGNNFRTFSSQIGRYGHLWQNSNFGSNLSWAGSFEGGVWQFNTESVDIRNATRQVIVDKNLLEVTASHAGTFYLRGYSMGDFDGSSWGKDPVDKSGFTTSDGIGGRTTGGRVLVLENYSLDEIDELHRTYGIDELYRLYGVEEEFDIDELYRLYGTTDEISQLRYYEPFARFTPADLASIYDNLNPTGRASRAMQMTIRRTGDYTQNIVYQPYYFKFDYARDTVFSEMLQQPRENFYYIDNLFNIVNWLADEGYFSQSFSGLNNDLYMKYYTAVDETTAAGLRRLARSAGINANADRYVVADAVAEFIMSSGTYTTEPGRIPDDADFALYFLEESKEGFCVHFATAAVLMLRSLDIPARFTSGFVVSVFYDEVETPVVVTDGNAHAWVEVYYDDIGWLYLEATPAGGNSNVPPPRPHTPQATVTPTPEVPSDTPPPMPDTTPDIPEGLRPEDTTDNRPSSGADETTVMNLFSIPTWLYNILMFLLYVSVILAALIIRRFLMKYIRNKKFNQENTNQAVMYIWKYVKKLGRQEIVPPNDIEEIALKARFSQHRLTEEERSVMIQFATRLSFEVFDGKDDITRFIIKYIRALY